MVFCTNCQNDVEAEKDHGFSCCVICGAVLEEGAFADEVQFVKGADGEGGVAGVAVGEDGQARGAGRFTAGRFYSSSGEAHAQSLYRGREELIHIVDHFNIRPREEAVESAHRLYRLAVQRGFTKGRGIRQVAAACLYIYCRLEKKPFMLIDFSDILQVNVFALGSVFLQLLRLLSLEEQPTFTKVIDPSLYTHRFADKLGFGKQTSQVANTALRLIGSMKRDWMQTGRRPAGVCGAALFVAAHIHGFDRSKVEIMEVVHVGYTTLDKRVREFALTDASTLTVTEFEERATDFEKEQARLLEEKEKEGGGTHDLLAACEHVDNGLSQHFAHGMCRDCFVEYLTVSGGVMTGAADPPAWTRNKKKELKGVKKNVPLLTAPGELITYPEDAEGDADDIDEMEEALDAEEALEPFANMVQTGEPKKKKARTLASVRQEAAAMMAKGKDPSDALGASGSGGPSSMPHMLGAASCSAGKGGNEHYKGGGKSGKGDSKGGSESLEDAESGGTQSKGKEVAMGGEAEGAGGSSEPGEGGREGATNVEGSESEIVEGGATEEVIGVGEEGAGMVAGKDASSNMKVTSSAETGRGGSGAGGEIEDAEADGESGEEGEGEGGTGGKAPEVLEGLVEELDGDMKALVTVQDEEEEDGRLSDLDDEEIDEYITHNEEEVELKRQIWEHLNHDWIQKQAEKAAAAAEEQASGKPKRTYTRKKREAINADSATDATRQMLEQKKLSSKVNYNALDSIMGNLFDDEEDEGQGDEWSFGTKGRVNQELQEKAKEAAAAEAQAADKYSAMLEATKRRAGGSLTGSFLDTLTTAKPKERGRLGGMRR